MEAGLGFPNRQNGYGIDIFTAPLGGGVKIAHGIQFIAKELCADGQIGSRGEDVHNAAADGKLSAALYHTAAAVAGGGEPGNQDFQRIFFSHFQRKCGAEQHILRHGTLAEGFPGQNLHRGAAGGKVVELPQTLLFPCPGHNSSVIKGQFPSGQDGEGIAQKVFQFFLQSVGGNIILTQQNHRPLQIPAKAGDHMAAVDLSDAGDGDTFSLAQRGYSGGIFRNGFE